MHTVAKRKCCHKINWGWSFYRLARIKLGELENSCISEYQMASNIEPKYRSWFVHFCACTLFNLKPYWNTMMCPDFCTIVCSSAVFSAAHCCRLNPCGETLSTTSVAPVWSTRARRMKLLCEMKLQQLELEQQLCVVKDWLRQSQQTSCALLLKHCISELRCCDLLTKLHVTSPFLHPGYWVF